MDNKLMMVARDVPFPLRKAKKNLENQLLCFRKIDFPRCSQRWLLPWLLVVQECYYPSHHSTISNGKKLVPFPKYHLPFPGTSHCNLHEAKLSHWETATRGNQLSRLGTDCYQAQCTRERHLQFVDLLPISTSQRISKGHS